MQDFIDVTQSNEDMLLMVSDEDMLSLSSKDLNDCEGVTYPCILLSKVLFNDALRVIKSYKRESYRSVDVWLELDGDNRFEHIGKIQLTLEVLLVLRYLQIVVTIYYDKDSVEVINFEEPEALLRFV